MEKKKKKKLADRKTRKKNKMEEVATKMKHMVGVGPIAEISIVHFENKTKYKAEAFKLAVREYLKYFPDFDDEELREMVKDDVEEKRAADRSLKHRLDGVIKILKFKQRQKEKLTVQVNQLEGPHGGYPAS